MPHPSPVVPRHPTPTPAPTSRRPARPRSRRRPGTPRLLGPIGPLALALALGLLAVGCGPTRAGAPTPDAPSAASATTPTDPHGHHANEPDAAGHGHDGGHAANEGERRAVEHAEHGTGHDEAGPTDPEGVEDRGHHDSHADPAAAGGTAPANRVVLAGTEVVVTPALAPGAGARLLLEPAPAGPLEARLVAPDGTARTLASPRGSVAGGLVLPWSDAPPAEGVWRLDLRVAGSRAQLPIGVAHGRADGVEATLVLVPAPSLGGGGRSEAFVVATRGGEPVHAAASLSRAMPGMRHSTDEERVALRHDHRELGDAGGGATAMADRGPLSFAMAGTWRVVLRLAGEPPSEIPFDVVMDGE